MRQVLFYIVLFVVSLFLTIAYAQEPWPIEVTKVQICGQDIAGLQRLDLISKDLVDDQIKITGLVKAETAGVDKIQISLDGGINWEDVFSEESWEFAFTPEDETEYNILILAFDLEGKVSRPWAIDLSYRDINNEDLVRYGLESLARAYNNKRLIQFMAHFSPKHYPDYLAFEKKIKDTFANNESLSLEITVTNVEITGNNAVVTADWTKTWAQDSFAEGSCLFSLVRKGTWQVSSLDNQAIFIIESAAE